MWHQSQFAGGCWDGPTAPAGTGVDFGGVSSVIPTDSTGDVYNHHPTPVYGCSFGGVAGGSGAYVGGYEGTTAGAAPYYGMYSLPSLAAASQWSAGHTPSLGYNAVRRLIVLLRTVRMEEQQYKIPLLHSRFTLGWRCSSVVERRL